MLFVPHREVLISTSKRADVYSTLLQLACTVLIDFVVNGPSPWRLDCLIIHLMGNTNP